MKDKDGRLRFWFSLLGVLLLLVGVYTILRVGINEAAFDKYPQGGVYPINFSGNAPIFQRESDCTYAQTYYDNNGNLRQPNTQEKKMSAQDKKRCLDGVADTRRTSEANDLSAAGFFLFVGAAFLLIRRHYLK